MYIIAILVAVPLIILAGAELFLSHYNSDELSNMGVEHR